jgi:hypothetical protein
MSFSIKQPYVDKRNGFAFPRILLSFLASALASCSLSAVTKPSLLSRKIILGSIAGMFVIPAVSFTQWQKVNFPANPAPSYNGWSMFFFSELRGMVGVSAAPAYGIYLTDDGGKSWKKASIPIGFAGDITQLTMLDTLHGWATVEEPGNLPALWRTNDGGLSWTTTGLGGNYVCVYQTSKAINVTSRDLTRSGEISTNGGLTFSPSTYKITNGIDFIDDNIGVITGFKDTTSWYRTTDGGQSWIPISPAQKSEAWSIYADKSTRIFYTAGERDPNSRTPSSKSVVLRSIDSGITWQTIYTFPFITNGHIHGSKGHLYVQVENTPANGTYTGLYRSDDGGFTWKSVSGPHHENDKRFFVTGCNGGIVYAFDDNLGLWKTRNGGDGSIFEPDPAPVFTGLPIQFSVRLCATAQASIRISNFYCEDLIIQGAEFVDPNDPLLLSGALTITNSSALPKIIGNGATDSITFLWDPIKLFHNDTTVATQIRIRYFSNALKKQLDTIIAIDAHAVGDPPNAALVPPALNYGAVSFCTPHDSLFTFTNNGCDTLFILSGIPAPPIFYNILDNNGNPLVYPIRLAPGASFTYRLSLELRSSGNFSSTITFRLRHQGKIKDTTLLVSASTTSKGSYAAPQDILMGSVSICSFKDSLILLKNLACDTLILSKASLKNAVDFSLLGVILPEQIYADSTSALKLRLKPLSLGLLTDTLILEFTSLGEKIILKIPVEGTGVSGEATLVTLPPVDTLFDLTLSRCDSPRVFPVTLINPGCKNITIKAVDIQGAPPENVSAAVLQTLPKPINDNGTVGVIVTVTPKTIGIFNGSLRVRYQIEGEGDKDTLFAFSLVVKYGKRVLTMTPDSIDLGTMKLCDTKDATILLKNIGCDTLTLRAAGWQSDIGTFVTNYSPRFPLGPGDTTSVHLTFIPTYSGVSRSIYSVSTTTDSTDPLVCVIRANVTPTDTIRLHLAPVRTSFHVGDTVTVLLTTEEDVPLSLRLRDIAFGLNFNGDLLTIVDAKSLVPSSQLLSGTSTRTLPAKLETQQYLLNGSPFLSFSKQTPLLELRFIVRLTDTTTTTFFLSNIMLNSSEKDFAKCTLGLISGEASAELTLLCGDSTLREFLRNGSILLSTKPVIPNPVTEDNGWKAHIPFNVAEASVVRCLIIDEIGRIVRTETRNTLAGGSFEFVIDAKDLASGTYSYLLELPNNPHTTTGGRFVLSK